MSVKFGINEKLIRHWLWYYAAILCELERESIQLPEHIPDDVAFPLAVDGTHCFIYEPLHENLPVDSTFYSHKGKTAAFAYQLAISTTESKILSLHGPYPAGAYNDKRMFVESGLQEYLVSRGKYAIADGGYEGLEGVAVPNRRYHNRVTNIYFRRQRARVERLMMYFKNYRILSTTFRVRVDRENKHGMVFRAVGAIAQVQLETTNPMFEA